jgi:tRNA-uridine 2-sulfurtransferase
VGSHFFSATLIFIKCATINNKIFLIMRPLKLKKIVIALSGGVDSAVAAARLLKQGHKVMGVFFRFFGTGSSNIQVKKIAKKLGIPLKIIDARKEFKKRVIDYFVSSYKNGLTPNPCIVCNKGMKFRILFSLLRKYDANYIATGHYASIKARPFIQGSTFLFPDYSSGNSSRSNLWEIPQGRTLCEAKDKSKDQSYFLYRLSQKELSKIIFPLGDYKKAEVKKIAKKLKLPVAKDESQDICFLQNEDLNYFLRKNIRLKVGNIVDSGGNILGKHQGLPLYTIGQRKGIEIGPPRPTRGRVEAGGTGPYFVVGKNIRKNEITVTNDPKKLFVKRFIINNVNWVNQGNSENRREDYTIRAQIQIRYHAPKVSAIIKSLGNGRWEVKSAEFLRAVTPGQSVVFYRKGEVLGGGIIIHAN